MSRMAEETRIIINLLNKFGCLTKEQINKMCEGTGFNPKPMIAYMCNARMIQFLDNNFAVLQNRPKYTPETIYSMWVMLDKIKDENIIKSLELRSANPCDNGIDICFINRGQVIEYVAFIDKNSIVKVSLIQDTFYTATGVTPGNEKQSKRLYTFVVNDEEVMERLAEMNLTIPFMVAYIEGDISEVPTIEYYQL